MDWSDAWTIPWVVAPFRLLNAWKPNPAAVEKACRNAGLAFVDRVELPGGQALVLLEPAALHVRYEGDEPQIIVWFSADDEEAILAAADKAIGSESVEQVPCSGEPGDWWLFNGHLAGLAALEDADSRPIRFARSFSIVELREFESERVHGLLITFR